MLKFHIRSTFFSESVGTLLVVCHLRPKCNVDGLYGTYMGSILMAHSHRHRASMAGSRLFCDHVT